MDNTWTYCPLLVNLSTKQGSYPDWEGTKLGEVVESSFSNFTKSQREGKDTVFLTERIFCETTAAQTDIKKNCSCFLQTFNLCFRFSVDRSDVSCEITKTCKFVCFFLHLLAWMCALMKVMTKRAAGLLNCEQLYFCQRCSVKLLFAALFRKPTLGGAFFWSCVWVKTPALCKQQLDVLLCLGVYDDMLCSTTGPRTVPPCCA